MFTGNAVWLAGLAKFELPSSVTVRLCDGGLVKWGAETFESAHATFGTLAAIDAPREGMGDLAPGSRVTLLPPSTAAAATLSSPSYQGSRMRFWIAEVNQATGNVTGTPELMFDGLLDATVLRLDKGRRELDIEFVSRAERLFSVNEGNVCAPRFHQRIWPGEQGFDNAAGVGLTVAWGVKAPPRGTVGTGGGFGGGGGSPAFPFWGGGGGFRGFDQ